MPGMESGRGMTMHRLAACVVSATLLVASCSSGGGKHASPTTASPTTSTTAVTTTTMSLSHVVADLGPCPSTNSAFGSAATNSGVRALTKKMVPITALNVLVCRYGLEGQLTRVAVLKPVTAAQLEADTNKLPASTRAASFSCRPTQQSFSLTFANDTQQVQVQDACGAMINGRSWARPTPKWLNELANYPSSPAPPPEFCCQTTLGGVTGPESGAPNGQVTFTNRLYQGSPPRTIYGSREINGSEMPTSKRHATGS